MPGINSASLLNTFADRDAISAIFARATNVTNATTTTNHALQVVCAFPVSGQYGPGSRVLYYVLVAACVFARKSDLLMNACLAAALLFPAVAAFHAVVLAALHVDGVVDMDVFGAFQLCSIGVLAAPVMARMSNTYFYSSGRNIIFLWTGLIFAGLLSLTVEFYRATSIPCSKDDDGTPISSISKLFPYDKTPTCGLVCSTTAGPFSHLRGGSVNNIYVIPAPEKLTFGEATILAAACCVPAILSLISMRNKILDFQWKKRAGKHRPEQDERKRIEGTKATIGMMNNVNKTLGMVLGRVEIVVFGGAVLAILIIGEWNFFTKQVYYESEPMYAIGQWAPIVGTSLAVIGSLGLFLVQDKPGDEEENFDPSGRHPNCSHCDHGHSRARRPTFELQTDDMDDPQSGGEGHGVDDYVQKHTNEHREFETSSVAIDWTDDARFKAGPAHDFPLTPGEEFKRDTRPIQENWTQHHARRGTDGELTPTALHHASTFSGSASATSINAMERWPTVPQSSSPEMMQRNSTLEVPPAAHFGQARTRSNSSGAGAIAGLGLESMAGPSSPRELPKRKNTLEVPLEHHVTRTRSESSGSHALSHFRESAMPKDSGSDTDKG